MSKDYREGDRQLVYVGAVKAGLSSKLLEKWGKRLTELMQTDCPFTNLTQRSSHKRSVWLWPELLAQVRYLEQAESGSLRHAALLKIEG